MKNTFNKMNKKERGRSVSNSIALFDSDFEEIISSYRSLIKKLNLSFKNFILKLKSNLNKNSNINKENPNLLKISEEINIFEKKEDQLYSIIKKHLKTEKKKKDTVVLKKNFKEGKQWLHHQ